MIGASLVPCRWSCLAGKLVPAERAAVPADNFALHYGAAAFESLRVYRTPFGPRIVGLEQHFRRLRASVASLGLAPIDEDRVREAVLLTIRENGLEQGYLRLLAYPAGPCTVLDPARYSTEPLVVGWHTQGPRVLPPISLGVSPIRRPAAGSSLPRAKHTGMYGVYAASHHAMRARGVEDALVLHADGTVCEVTGANLFAVRDERLLTPLIPHSIDGITRRLVTELAAERGIAVHETILCLEDVVSASEVFVTGTFHGIRAVASVEGAMPSAVPPGPVTRGLQEAFEQLVDTEASPMAERWLTLVRAPRPGRPGVATGPGVRLAREEDVPAVLEGVRSLLAELRGLPELRLPDGAREVCERLVRGEAPGAVFVAPPGEGGSGVWGLLSITVQEAIHHGGPYVLIQDLWVHPDGRSRSVGAQLVEALELYCREHGYADIEVGLPPPSFAGLPGTHRFYQRCGFAEVGPRLRKRLG